MNFNMFSLVLLFSLLVVNGEPLPLTSPEPVGPNVCSYEEIHMTNVTQTTFVPFKVFEYRYCFRFPTFSCKSQK